MLGGVRPSGTRRSWWLREALAAEAVAAPQLATAAPPLRGTTTADVVVVGGGYTGMWAALRLTELEPGARVVLLEADICGGGPSGRNGGFVTNWWDEFPTLMERYGEVGARAMGEAIEAAVDDVGAFCAEHGIDAWYTKAGSLSVSAAPAQDGAWDEAVSALGAHGLGDRLVPMSAEEVASRVRSPVFRDGAFMPGAATVQPAALARGLRRVLLERGVAIFEGTEAVEIDGHDRGPFGALGARARRAPSRRGNDVGLRPVRVRTRSSGGDSEGEVLAASAILAMNAWAAAWPWFGRRLVTWSSYIVLTEPIPDRLADLGWTGGEGVADAEVNFATGQAHVTLDRPVPAVDLQARVEKIGYGLTPLADTPQAGDDPQERARRSWLRRVLLVAPAAVFAVVTMLAGPTRMADWRWRLALLAVATLVQFGVGWPFLREAARRARRRTANMDTLIAVGTLAAYGYSVVQLLAGGMELYFETAILLIAFLTLGRYLEARARGRAGQAIRALLELDAKRTAFPPELSRGMKQRLCLAKTLVHDPAGADRREGPGRR